MQATYCLVGNNNLVLRCAQLLMEKNFSIIAILSDNKNIIDWCRVKSIANFPLTSPRNQQIQVNNCEYLIVLDHESNHLDITELTLVKYKIQLTTHSFLNDEAKYVIENAINNTLPYLAFSWDVINSVSNQPIASSKAKVAINKSDTTFSLNLKYYEQAAKSFERLINSLPRYIKHTRAISLPPSPSSSYEYHSIYSGIINWHAPAIQIKALLRALNYGDYNNNLALPKFYLGNTFFIVCEAKVKKNSSTCKPGTIVAINHNNLVVMTAENALELIDIRDSFGRLWRAADLLEQHSLKVGSCFPVFKLPQLQQINAYHKDIKNYEAFWLTKLETITPLSFFETIGISHNAHESVIDNNLKALIPINSFKLKKIQRLVTKEATRAEILLTIILIYLARLNNYAIFSTFIFDQRYEAKQEPLTYTFVESFLPFNFELNADKNFLELVKIIYQELESLHKYETYAKDLPLRNKIHTSINQLIHIHIIIAKEYKEILLPRTSDFALVIDCNLAQIHVFASHRLIRNQTDFSIINNITKHLPVFVNSITAQPNIPVWQLNYLPKNEASFLINKCNLTSSPYPQTSTIDDLFKKQVNTYPQRIALRYKSQAITYSQMDKMVEHLAQYLRYNNIQRGDIVAICIERSIEIMIAIFAIIRAGAAYLPLDSSYPANQLNFMLENSRSELLILSSSTKARFKLHSVNKLVLNKSFFKSDLSGHSSNANKIEISPTDRAYVIYTSGSTGLPKGVEICHRSVINHMIWMKDTFNFDSREVFLQKTPLSFDASVWEVFLPIFIGATLVVADNYAHKDPTAIIEHIDKYQITILQLVPSILREMLNAQLLFNQKFLKHLFVGGELLTREIRENFFSQCPHIKLHNLYGPTEATIDATYHTCINSCDELSHNLIGKPVNNTQVYVLDHKLQPLPVGVPGELYIGGDSLALGYLYNPELTNDRFIVNSIANTISKRLYKTGDLVRWTSTGNLDYIGRINNQVKIRGIRIELDAIEAYLRKHPGVDNCVVILHKKQNNDPILVAYIALVKTAKPSEINAKHFRHFLKENIPEYMIPSSFIILEQLPLTPNGKIDRKALPAPTDNSLGFGYKYNPPRNEAEEKLTKIWEKILSVQGISTKANFFELGGHSLKVLELINEITRTFSVKLTIKSIIQYPTIRKLAKALTRKPATNKDNQQSSFITRLSQAKGHPVFLIHPVGGTIFWFQKLARYAGNSINIYGISDPSIDNTANHFQTLPEMAEYYLTEIKKAQPKGPYCIGGASFGATLAIHIAHLLEKEHAQILPIPVFDGWAIYPDELQDDNYFRAIMKRQEEILQQESRKYGIENTIALLNLQKSRLDLLWKYDLPKINQEIVLFKSQELLAEYVKIQHPFNYLDKYTSHPIKKIVVPGNHESMFYEPNVEVLASHFVTIYSDIFMNLSNFEAKEITSAT